MGNSELRLDDQLCFALYAATNSITRAYRPLLRELGVTYPQYLTLMSLWQHGSDTVGGLAHRLDLPPHALTPLLRRLESAGLVARRRSPADGRSVVIELTPAGRRLESDAAAVQCRVVEATGLAEPDLAALRAGLHDLVDHLHAAAVGQAPMERDAS